MHQETKEGISARLNARTAPTHRLRRWIGGTGLLLAFALAGCQQDQTTAPADAEPAPDVAAEPAPAAGPDFGLASTSTVAPWRDETFSKYTSDAHWRSDPFGWMPTAPTGWNQSAIHIDRSVTYDGHPTLRYDWSGATASNTQCNKMIYRESGYYLPPAKEVWIEVVHKFKSNFNTNHKSAGGYCGTAELKFILPRLKGVSHRIGEVKNGVNGREWWAVHPHRPDQTTFGSSCSKIGWDCRFGYGTLQSSYLSAVPGPLWDDQWHVYRIHIKMPAVKGESTGVIEHWIDGKLVKRLTGQTFITRSGYFSNQFAHLSLGSNSNSGTRYPTSNWWGRLRIWTTNPGW